jgi:hypothetical protein
VTANASQAVCKHFLFLCLLTPFSQRQSLRQLCGFANLLFFDYKIFETFYKIKLWALKTVAAAASSFIL